METETTGTILIVDDEIPIQRSLRRSFYKLPYKIFTSSGAKEAFSIIEENDIDIILSDFKMPGLDGHTFLQRVKRSYPSIIRILISGYIDKSKLMESLFRFNVVSLFPKPWDIKLLLARIAELLSIKKSIKDIAIWNRLNNPVLFNIDKMSFQKDKLYEFIKYDIPIYTGLLHLYNSDYYNGDNQLDLMRIINHFSAESISDMISSIVNDNYLNRNLPMMRSNTEKMDKIYPYIKSKFQIKSRIGENLSPSFFILFRYIVFFIENNQKDNIETPTLFIKWNYNSFHFSERIKFRSTLLLSFLRLWNIATPLTEFSEKLYNTTHFHGFNELSDGERLLFLTDFFIHKNATGSREDILAEIGNLGLFSL